MSVYGTGAAWISLADFLGSMVTSILRCASAPYTLRFDSPADLPTGINIYTLQPAIPSAGRTVTSPSPRHSMRQYGNINPFFHRRRVRLCLRSRLTLIRLALIRKPWSFGGGVSRPPYRYSYHICFSMRSNKGHPSSSTRHGMLPYHVLRHPRLRQIVYARLLSTPDRSTSELLRTL